MGSDDRPAECLSEVHAVASATQHPSAATILRCPTRPECHATPMRIRGWVAEVRNHFIKVTRFACGIATQPAVA